MPHIIQLALIFAKQLSNKNKKDAGNFFLLKGLSLPNLNSIFRLGYPHLYNPLLLVVKP
jgi:hypothetical protein